MNWRLPADIWAHPANRGARVAAMARALGWQCRKRLFALRYRDIAFHGLTLRCPVSSHSASRAIYFSNLPDWREMRFMLDYLRDGDCFVDVGANVGLYTLLARSIVGGRGQVDAFEPNALIADQLAESLALNAVSNVSVHRVALSDTSGRAGFVQGDDDCTAHVAAHEDETTASVATARLDEHLPQRPYAMMKLDIEGFEPFALAGASRWLADGNPPVLQVEMAGYSQRYGVSTPQLIGQLRQLGYYTAVYVPETRRLHATQRPWEIPVDNVLGICKARESMVLARLAGDADAL